MDPCERVFLTWTLMGKGLRGPCRSLMKEILRYVLILETIQDLRARLEKVEAIQVERLVLAANPRGRPSARVRRSKR